MGWVLGSHCVLWLCRDGFDLLRIGFCVCCAFQMLDELPTDQWPIPPGNRASRCTGVALSVAVGLLGACSTGTGARIIALVGGPCTEGPGTVKREEKRTILTRVICYYCL